MGLDGANPDLVSSTTSGYPFCQSLANEAREIGVDGLHAPSARRPGGVCVPVFSEQAIGGHKIADMLDVST